MVGRLAQEIAPGVDLVHARDRYIWYASIARMAPSKHNTQPWRFVVSDRSLDIWADRSRRLPVTDPRDRELVLSCGAAVQAALVAATALGVRLDVHAWPEGLDGPAARLREVGRGHPTPEDRTLLAAVTRRRTDRGPLDASALPPSLPFMLDDVVTAHGCLLRLVRSEGDQRTLERVIDLADRQLARMTEVDEEVRQWVRLPCEPPSPDGVPASATRGRSAASALFPQRDFSAPGVPPRHEREGVDAPLLAVLATHADDPVHWLQGGRALMAVLLVVTAVGGGASYLNQPLELQRTRDLLREDLGLTGHPQVVLRIGAGGPVEAPPRRAVIDLVERPGT